VLKIKARKRIVAGRGDDKFYIRKKETLVNKIKKK